MRSILISIIIFCQFIFAGEKPKNIELTKPPKKIGMDLIQTLRLRKSINEYSAKKIDLDTVGIMLWAANGVNREDGRHTAPSAFNSQFINIYVATDKAVYLYDSVEHSLLALVSGNIKDKIGIQEFVKTAPVILIMTASLKKLPAYAGGRSTRITYAHANAGCIAQNIYLAAAALNLGTRYIMFINDKGLKYYLHLDNDELPLSLMPIGYPKQ